MTAHQRQLIPPKLFRKINGSFCTFSAYLNLRNFALLEPLNEEYDQKVICTNLLTSFRIAVKMAILDSRIKLQE